MGVSRNDYIMVGADLGKDFIDDDNYEKYEDFMNGVPDSPIDIIDDGMSGQYCYVGKVLMRSDEYDGFDSKEDLQVKIDAHPLDDVKKRIKEHLGVDVEVRLICFTHWH